MFLNRLRCLGSLNSGSSIVAMRNADLDDVIALQRFGQRFGIVVQQVTAGL